MARRRSEDCRSLAAEERRIAMREGSIDLSLPAIAASGVILTILFFQAVAVFDLRFGPIGRAPYLYPFLDYPMYSRVHQEGEAITQYRVYAVLADSSEALVRPSDLGLSFWLYHNGLITGLRRGGRGEGPSLRQICMGRETEFASRRFVWKITRSF